MSRLFACLVVAAVLSIETSHAQRAASPSRPWTPPHTEWGAPDLQGIWNFATLTPLERPKEFTGKAVLTPEEAKEYERVTDKRQRENNSTAGPDWWDPAGRFLVDRRTALVVEPADGRLPPTTPEAQAKAARNMQQRKQRGELDGPEDLGLNVRCIMWATAGPPMLPGVYNNDVQIVQTPAYVVFYNEMIHDVRIVPLDDRPRSSVPRWMGESRARWEGQTLVVDTTNFNGKAPLRGSDERLHLVERFTRTGADAITYEFTVDDATVWTRPWTVAFPLRRTDQPMYEYACHEGNGWSMEGLLRAARTSEPQAR